MLQVYAYAGEYYCKLKPFAQPDYDLGSSWHTSVFVARLPCFLKSMSLFVALQKAYNRQRKQIWKHEATIAKQAAIIQKMKAELKALKATRSKKTMKATKSMKAK